jgi:hypothetical protein
MRATSSSGVRRAAGGRFKDRTPRREECSNCKTNNKGENNKGGNNNERNDYERRKSRAVDDYESERSAVLPHRVTCGVLNRLHIDALQHQNRGFQNVKKQDEKNGNEKNGNEKNGNEAYQYHHHHHVHHHHHDHHDQDRHMQHMQHVQQHNGNPKQKSVNATLNTTSPSSGMAGLAYWQDDAFKPGKPQSRVSGCKCSTKSTRVSLPGTHHDIACLPLTTLQSEKLSAKAAGAVEAVNNSLLVPVGRSGSSSANNIRNRIKHPRLVGADLYVARLCNTPPLSSSKVPRKNSQPRISQSEATCRDDIDDTSGTSTPSSTSSASTGSLHDELINKEPKPRVSDLATKFSSSLDTCENAPPKTAAESRPCYRCVAYMHGVGIKRVFWTNKDGAWEVAKVRDLMDRLDGTAPAGIAAGEDGVKDLGLFVTKHELLMMQRIFGIGPP